MSLCVEQLSKSYGLRKVFSDVYFEVPEGAHLAIWGPNGAGKTTLLRMLATLERPTSGMIVFNGYDTVKDANALRESIGMLGHKTMLYTDLSALENLVFYGRLYGVANPEKRAEELLRHVGLHMRRLDAVKTFSQGMQQRVALARALMHEPELILLDEPYSGLDTTSAEMLSVLLREETNNATCVMVSHDRRMVAEFCTHVLLLGGPGATSSGRTSNSPIFQDVKGASTEEIMSLLEGGDRV